MFVHVEKAQYVDGYKIALEFNEGTKGVADLEKRLGSGVFEVLKDKKIFQSFTVDSELHTITWPNGADLAPEYLYKLITGHYPPYVQE